MTLLDLGFIKIIGGNADHILEELEKLQNYREMII